MELAFLFLFLCSQVVNNNYCCTTCTKSDLAHALLFERYFIQKLTLSLVLTVR